MQKIIRWVVLVPLLAGWSCGGKTFVLSIDLDAAGGGSIVWAEAVRYFQDYIPCEPDRFEPDPLGSGTAFFGEKGINASISGWAVAEGVPGAGTCFLWTQVSFVADTDWNAYVPLYVAYLSGESPDYVYEIPIPGVLLFATAPGGEVEARWGTEVLAVALAEYGSILQWAPPGTALAISLSLPCPVVDTTPPATVVEGVAVWTLAADEPLPPELAAATGPGCSLG